MSNIYTVGMTIGNLVVIGEKYKPSSSNDYKIKVRCIDCETVTEKWISALTTVQKTGIKSCKTCRDLSYRRTDNKSAIYKMWMSYKSNAKSRNLSFNLTLDEFYEIASKDCFFCKAPPTARTPVKSWQQPAIMNGIDRLDNSQGYFIENCVPCCYDCNRSKSNLTIQEFQAWSERIASNAWWNKQGDK